MTHIEKKKVKGYEYYYIVRKKWDPKKKNSVRVSQISLGTIKDIEKNLACARPHKASAKNFGDVFAVYQTIVELGIDNIINNLPISEKEAKLILISIINRACNATSKNKLNSWYQKTSLFKQIPMTQNEMQSSSYTKLMKKVKDEDIDNSLDELLKNLLQLGVDTQDIILDNTNYTTRLRPNNNLTLAKLGKSKDGKTGRLQINIQMVVSRDGKIPLTFKPYQGNINDPDFFSINRQKLLELGSKIQPDNKKVTLSIDAGHNSDDNIKDVDSKYNFIGTLRPSTCKDLIGKPSKEFPITVKLDKNETIKIYSEKRTIYEKEYLVVVSQFSKTQRRSCHTFNDNINKIVNEIKLFEHDLNETFKAEEAGLKKKRSKFHDIEKVKTKIEGIIKSKKHVKEVLSTDVKLTKNRISISIEINNSKVKKIEDQFGRAIRFTNRNDLTPEEVIEYYRGQYMVEHQFRDLKDPHLTSLMPMFHRKDETIKMFLFTNYLALVILTYMERKIKRKLELTMGKETMLEELEEMREIMMVFGKKITSVINDTSELQKKLYGLFELENYYDLPI